MKHNWRITLALALVVAISAAGSGIQQPVTQLGTITTYNNVTLAGQGLPIIVGSVRQVSQVAAISATTLFATGASTAEYVAHATLNCDTASAAATVTVSILYTDASSTAQTTTSGTATCTTLGASSVASFVVVFTAKNGTNIQYSTAIANTPTYDVRVTITQLTTN